MQISVTFKFPYLHALFLLCISVGTVQSSQEVCNCLKVCNGFFPLNFEHQANILDTKGFCILFRFRGSEVLELIILGKHARKFPVFLKVCTEILAEFTDSNYKLKFHFALVRFMSLKIKLILSKTYILLLCLNCLTKKKFWFFFIYQGM